MVMGRILLVDLSPTFYSLPKPLLVYGSMLLLSRSILSSYGVIVVMLGYDWGLRMVINIRVQYIKYNGGFLPDIILLTQSWLEYHVVFKKNLNASKPSEHPPQVEECLKV